MCSWNFLLKLNPWSQVILEVQQAIVIFKSTLKNFKNHLIFHSIISSTTIVLMSSLAAVASSQKPSTNPYQKILEWHRRRSEEAMSNKSFKIKL
jgi:predicted small integral membrane protein